MHAEKAHAQRLAAQFGPRAFILEVLVDRRDAPLRK
jgi:hypothetical protein